MFTNFSKKVLPFDFMNFKHILFEKKIYFIHKAVMHYTILLLQFNNTIIVFNSVYYIILYTKYENVFMISK